MSGLSGPIVGSWTEQVTMETAVGLMVLREREITMRLQPKPRWLPRRLWLRICARLVVIEEQQ